MYFVNRINYATYIHNTNAVRKRYYDINVRCIYHDRWSAHNLISNITFCLSFCLFSYQQLLIFYLPWLLVISDEDEYVKSFNQGVLCVEILLRQMSCASATIGNHELKALFEAGAKQIRRGVVFAASLYL